MECRTFRSWSRSCLSIALSAVSVSACADTDAVTPPVPEPDYGAFVQTVYPILLRDCAFSGCHGQHERFFQVFGPGRTRLSAGTGPYDPPTEQERRNAYDRARSMLIDRGDGDDLPTFLRKPLARSLGGAEHRGDDGWDQPVYKSKSDPGYQALAAWALGSVDAGAVP